MLNTLKQTNYPLYIATLFSIFMWEEEDQTPMVEDRTDEDGIPSYE